jgi:hypothetical protein
MRRFSNVVTIVITSSALTLAGLVASPIATASENETVRVSSRFAFGSPLLTNTHKAAIEKAVTTFGTDATFIVTAEAGKLPGVSDSEVQLLAIKRGQVFKSHLVKLGVKDSSVTIKVKMTRIGIVPKTKIAGSYAAPLVTTATAASPNNGPAAPTCASIGTYIVGATGPGGGIVYYEHNSCFNCGPAHTNTGSPTGGLCRYLEVAPRGWSGVAADPAKLWAVSANQSRDVDGITGGGGGVAITNDSVANNNASGIGLGYKNSVAIVTQGNDATTAAGAARAYRPTVSSVTYSDWYLPTTAELNLLCQWNHGRTQDVTTSCQTSGATTLTLNTGPGASGSNFTPNDRWSSSEKDSGDAWSQIFGGGLQSTGWKGPGTADVRPVRAF